MCVAFQSLKFNWNSIEDSIKGWEQKFGECHWCVWSEKIQRTVCVVEQTPRGVVERAFSAYVCDVLVPKHRMRCRRQLAVCVLSPHLITRDYIEVDFVCFPPICHFFGGLKPPNFEVRMGFWLHCNQNLLFLCVEVQQLKKLNKIQIESEQVRKPLQMSDMCELHTHTGERERV